MRTQIRTSCFAGGGGGGVRGRGSGPEIQARKEGSGTEKRRKCRNMTERETLSAQRDFYWTRTEQRSSQLSVAVSHVLMLPWQLPLSKVRLPTTKLEAKKKCVPHRVLHVGFIHRSSAVSSSAQIDRESPRTTALNIGLMSVCSTRKITSRAESNKKRNLPEPERKHFEVTWDQPSGVKKTKKQKNLFNKVRGLKLAGQVRPSG